MKRKIAGVPDLGAGDLSLSGFGEREKNASKQENGTTLCGVHTGPWWTTSAF
jgi:hypothetical protein